MLAEWHLTPEYIIEKWSNEKLKLMVDKLVERKRKQLGNEPATVSERYLFSQAGIKVVKN